MRAASAMAGMPQDVVIAETLLVPAATSPKKIFPTLAMLRAEIEAVDARLIAMLAERIALARAAGEVKSQDSQPVVDPAREAAVVTRAVALARSAGLAEEDTRALYWRIMAMSRRAQHALPSPRGRAPDSPSR